MLFLIIKDFHTFILKELHKRTRNYLISKAKEIDRAVDNVLSNVITKVSKRNIETLGKVRF